MESIINFGIPHVGEQIFEGLGDDDLIQCLRVSQTWKVFAENILLPKWKGKMFEACESGQKEIVKLLLNHFNSGFNFKDAWGRNSFIIACQNGHKDVVKMLLDHSEGNIDFNARSNSGWTAFRLACFKGHKDVVNLLLEYANAKGIKIPSSQWLYSHGNLLKEIKNLIDEYQAGQK